MGSGGYEPITEQLFNELAVDGFLLEFDTDRAGSFAPLRLLPETKRAFLGVISSKTDRVEHLDHVMGRLDEAFEYAPAERLGICPQCGFASSAAGNPITTEVQWRKLELAVDASRRVWGER